MNKIFKITLFLLWSAQLSGQSLKDELAECAETYRNHVNYFMAADTRTQTDLNSKFHAFFRAGTYIAHAFPQLPPQLTVQEYGIALSKFSDNSELRLEGLRYSRSTEHAAIFEIYAMQTFIGDYLNPNPQQLPRFGVILSVIREADGIFRIVDIAPMHQEFENAPDFDGDGIPDKLDKCPWLAGGLETDGAHAFKRCPQDTDDDGTPDNLDKCPNQFGEPEDGGCPNYTANELEAIRRIQEVIKAGADSLNLAALSLKRLPSIIKNLTNLKKLSLEAYGTDYQHNNLIEDLSAIRNLKQLTHLYLNGCPIKDISVLSQLPLLISLNLSHTQIDIRTISGLKQLQILNLSGNKLTDIYPLKNLPQLMELSLLRNRLTDISPIENLIRLKELELFGNRIEDISPIANLKHMQRLGLNCNRIKNISALRYLTQLESLDVANNSFVEGDSDPLYHNQISDISALRDLKQLTSLNLSVNQIKDISFLKDLKQLERLNLWSNQISNISFLEDLKQLATLELNNNQIKNFNLDLNLLPNLKYLNIEKNPIQNIPKAIVEQWNPIEAIRTYQKTAKR